MQDTRLNRILNESGARLETWFQNPWRRITGLLLSLLSGFLLGNITTTTAGQAAQNDGLMAFIFVVIIEAVNFVSYRGKALAARAFWADSLNAVKIGFLYSLFLDALKLGS